MGRVISRGPANAFQYTNQFGNAYWGKFNSTVVDDAGVDPFGRTEADKLNDAAGMAQHGLGRATEPDLCGWQAVSVYAQADELDFIYLQIFDNGAVALRARAWFNLNTGAVGTIAFGAARIEPAGGTWYRCCVYADLVPGNTHEIDCILANADNAAAYNGAGGEGVLLSGIQVNPGQIPDPYVENYEVARRSSMVQ